MRVLVLSDYFLPHASGGIERAAFEVSRRIAGLGHDVTIVTFRRGDAAHEEEMGGLRVVRVPAIDMSNLIGIQVSASAHAWPAVRSLIRERNIDLLHCHGLFFHLSLVAAVLARVTAVPLVTTAHVGSLDAIGGLSARITALYEHSVGKFILSQSRQVIAVSHAVATHVERLGAASNRLSVIPNGVDTARYRPSPQFRANQPPRMICVGRLIVNKGPQYLISALPQVVNRFPDAECWFVGDGPMRQDLERAVRRERLEKNVRFLGERDDVPELLSSSDIFVRPSLSEGMPLAVLEAMAVGLPVVATRVGGTAEVVSDGDSGFLVDPCDSEALSARLCQLLTENELREHMSDLGRRLAMNFDWDAVSRKTLDVYSRALKGAEKEWQRAA